MAGHRRHPLPLPSLDQAIWDALEVTLARALRCEGALSRRYRRGHKVSLNDFMPDQGGGEEGFPRHLVLAAFAAYRAFLGTLAAIAASIEPAPAPAGRPDDAPAPVEPLERLTSISPNAPSTAPIREALAA
jgi:hypothetical protein